MAPATRAVFVGLCAAMLVLTTRRLLFGTKAAPYALAQADHAVAGLALAVATASPPVTLAISLIIAIAIAVTFIAPWRLALAFATTWLLLHFLVSLALSGHGHTTASSFSAIAFAIMLVSISLLVLILIGLDARHMHQALRNRESQLQAVLEVTPVLLVSVDRDDDITVLAGSADQWSGWTGQRLSSSPEVLEVIADARNGSRVQREVTIADHVLFLGCDRCKDGSLLLTAYDTTLQARARDRLEGTIRARDQFIAAVSHELRTPLSSILGFAELIKEMARTEDELIPFIAEVVNQSAEMAAIIDDLLVAARASTETLATSPREFDLAEETLSVVETIAGRLATTPEFRCATPLAVYADPLRTRQIIRNLVTNADRYGGKTIVVQTRDDGESAILEVRDDGDPIPEQRRQRIFEPYWTSGPVRGAPAAIGLGLAVSRTLAELMGGAVSYRHDGEWSIFELALPLHQPALESAEA